MEGYPVLLTDHDEGKWNLMEFLLEKKSKPFVFVKDFENIHEIYHRYNSATPIVLNVGQSYESTIDHIAALPVMACVFNYDGEEFENAYRETSDHMKTLTICKGDFDVRNIYADILDAITEGCTLIINLVSPSVPAATRGNIHNEAPTAPLPVKSTQQFKFTLEKIFLRNTQSENLEKLEPAKSYHQCAVTNPKRNTRNIRNTGSVNPVASLFRRIFARFNPCAAGTPPILNIIPVCHCSSNHSIVKSPTEINIYVKSQQCQEIKAAFRTIHESACKNWILTCEENFRYTPELQHQFKEMCDEIERKGEEGRKGLLDKIHKDMERTKQWDHVLGTKALENVRVAKEKEVNLKVQHFCKRKITEAREKIAEEIKQQRVRSKGRFYREILDEQVMELMRIKEKYQKRKELLMLPYTGELKILYS